ncbi:pyruvate-formate lyase-activating enzyme [Rheinheimera pacifica]|uniref:hydrolase TatD n=1 Tax=Rheinheimera pacifica TaxID=173990 RepID=UPI00285777E4|nr:hydrolase TatD [Rheinheimera pacifica]MDR6984240.1 pyruvate-formate lyase-activating enzyme [Rheinheimera pacifica]
MSSSPYHYFDNQRLTLQSGNCLPAAQSLLQLAGNTQLLAQLAAEPGAQQLLDATEQAYQAGYEQQASTEFELQGLGFAGIGDPLLHMELLAAFLPAFKTKRHGVPVTLISYGLVVPSAAAALCQQLIELEVERLEIYLPATNPPAYQQAVKPSQLGFSDVCQFIHTASEAGLQVSCFAYAPVKQQSELRALALDLGARAFVVKPLAIV